ncbi:MAG: translesion DNA synthesis-associated protein ImuA [Methyloversatilis sp.]|jgi:protein ImuA|nr:translesion DNA synthesis-associated protein ImuA [Methyloversatilis sp.]MBP6195649.1 translesion DNA synthesis-associated protein ImuA [Methyloversatilis sp.]MBP9118694.1 translesion DNA synthesis-associated protein ImuA [Methyloversatilis sp.]
MTALSVAAQLRHPAVWCAGDELPAHHPCIPTGHTALDAALPGGGWPVGEMTELLTDCCGHGELSLLLPLMVSAANTTNAGGTDSRDGWLAWVAPPYAPGLSALSAAGLHTSRLLVIEAGTAGERAWSLRQALRSAACTVVVGWLDRIDGAMLRRLQLAVREAAIPLILFRPTREARSASPAAARLLLSASAPGSLRIDILKRRGRPASQPIHLPSGHAAVPQPPATAAAHHRLGTTAPALALIA